MKGGVSIKHTTRNGGGGAYEKGEKLVFAVVSTKALLLEFQFACFLGEFARCATESGAAVTA